MSWVLVLVLIHIDGVTTNRVPSFATEAQCQQIGRAWLAQVHRRENNSDIALYRCERKGAPN